MKYIRRNENGYTMLVVLLAVVLFMMLGASLLMLNMSGVSKNVSRESTTQAQDLAVKGLDYVVKEIEYKMENLAAGGLSPEQFNIQFNSLLDSYTCTNPNSMELQNTETGTATYCIETYDKVSNLKEVTFRSIGEAKEKEYVAKATYLLGSSVEDEFEYALVTYGNDASNVGKKDTTGNIELHGGLQIEGDIYSDNVFISSESSRYKNTIVPTVKPFVKSTVVDPYTAEPFTERIYQKAKTGEGDELQLIKIDKLAVPYNDKNKLATDLKFVKEEKYKAELFEDLEKLNEPGYEKKLFNPLPVKHLDGGVKVDFDVVNRIAKAKTAISQGIEPLKTGFLGSHIIPKINNYAALTESEIVKVGLTYPTKWSGATATALNTTKPKVFVQGYLPSSLESLAIGDINTFNWTLYGKNKFNSVIFPNNLSLSNGVKIPTEIDLLNLSTNPVLSVDKAYIENDMVIGLNNMNESNLGLFENVLSLDVLGLLGLLTKPINFDTVVELDGTYYVNGDLTISGARLIGNATFFVKGKTEIKFSDIGVNSDDFDEEYDINIISNGPVTLSYISNNHNNNEKLKESKLTKYTNDIYASTWVGHIHSNDKITINGATSNMILDGSMSAQEIDITSIAGRALPSCRSLGYYLEEHVVDGLLTNILKILISESGTKSLFDAIFGEENENNAFNLMLNKQGLKYTSNCFEKIAGQEADQVQVPQYLVKLLDLGVLELKKNGQDVEGRVQINYDPKPIQDLKQKYNIIYESTPKITQLDPPKAISRE